MISELYKLDRRLVFSAVILSLLLSLWAISVDNIVNNDGIEYIKAAGAILQGDWSAATQTFKWPFYSATFGFVSQITGLSLTNSAHLVNALAFAWITLSFVAVVKLLGGKRTTLWFALLVILAFPNLNKIRPFIIRDPVYIALFFSGCYAFLLHLKSHRPIHNVLAIICFMLGSLFRVESLIFLFVTQLYNFQGSLVYRSHRALSALLLGILLCVLILFISWWQFVPTSGHGYASILADPIAFLNEAWQQTSKEFEKRLFIIETKVLSEYAKAYAFVVLFWSAVSIVFIKFAHTLYYLYIALWFIAWRKDLLFPVKEYYRPWRFLLITALLILFGFVMVRWFLTDRYPLTGALLALLAVPFILAYWYERAKQSKRSRVALFVAIALIAITGIKSLDLHTKKHYLKDAAVWMKENMEPDALVYTNNRILAHYYDEDIFIDDYRTNDIDFYHTIFYSRDRLRHNYAAVNIKQYNAEFADNLIGALKRYVLVEFVNEKGSKVIIFDFSRHLQDTPHEVIYSE